MVDETGRIRNAAERHIYGRTRQNAGRRLYLPLSLLALLAVFALSFCRAGAPVYAQIVTPYPGAVMTATVAAQNMSAAQGAKNSASQQAASSAAQASAAAAQAQRAAQAAQQAAQAQAAADAQFNAAAQAAAEARAALVAQQVGAASEALGRAEESISAGREQLSSMSGAVNDLRSQLAQAKTDLQQERTSKDTAQKVNAALQKRLDEAESKFVVNPAIAAIVGVVVLFGVFGFVVWKWSRKSDAPPAEPPLEGVFSVTDDSADVK